MTQPAVVEPTRDTGFPVRLLLSFWQDIRTYSKEHCIIGNPIC